MTLNELQKSCQIEASIIKVKAVGENGEQIIKTYDMLSKSELANLYCDWDEKSWFATDEEEKAKAEMMRSAYWSAIMLRYWYKIFEWMSSSASLGLEQSEFYMWLHESLCDAFYYRSWRPHRFDDKEKDENGKRIKKWVEVNPQYVDYMNKWRETHPEATGPDPDAADRSINFFTAAKRGKEYQAANKDKRSSNFGNKCYSIDNSIDEDGHSMLDRDINFATEMKTFSPVYDLVSLFLSENKNLEALIIDSIANGDSMKSEKKKKMVTYHEMVDGKEEEIEDEVTYTTSNYNERKLVAYLNSLDEDFFANQFSKMYKITDYKPLYEQLKSLNNGKLYRAIDRTLEMVRQNPKYLSILKTLM